MEETMEHERDLQETRTDGTGDETATAEPRKRVQGTSALSRRGSVKRYRRRTTQRAKTIALKRLTKEEMLAGRELYPIEPYDRPKTRAECQHGPRPCPYVGCAYNLYLDVNPETGSIKLNFPHLEPWEMEESCALDVAERGGITLEEVGTIMNLTRERVRQVEVRATSKLKELSRDGDFLPMPFLRK